MSKHTAPRRRVLAGNRLLGRFVRVRLLLCLGILALPAGVGTMAYWTDTATIHGGTIESGTLDLTVGATVDDSGRLPGQGGTFEYSELTIGNMIPGESIARPFVVRNSGSVAFVYNAAVYTADNELVSGTNGLTVSVYTGGTPTNTGTEASGNRVGTCEEGSLDKTQAVSTSTSAVDLFGTDRLLPAGGYQVYCAKISMPESAPNALQGKGTSLIVALDAEQQGAPS